MKKIFFIIILLTSLKNFSQNAEDKVGVWYMFGASHQITEKWHITTLTHFRFFELSKDLQQLITRFGINYNFNKNINTTLGYAYNNNDTTYSVKGGETNEQRIYEDLNIKHSLSFLNFKHRFRLEHRFLESNTNHWIRYKLELNHFFTKKWAAFYFQEFFLNFQNEIFPQNRLSGGFSYKVSNLLKLKIGYLNQQRIITKFHRLQLGFFFST